MTAPEFLQDGPQLPHPYRSDELLQAYLRRLFGDEHAAVDAEMARLGDRVLGDIGAHGDDANAHEPRLVRFDGWGHRVDRIETSAGWRALKGIAAEEGLVSLGYERPHGWKSRVLQFAKLYLYAPSSAIFSCPLAMTDGAARLLSTLRSQPELAAAYDALTTRDPQAFWTSGQWMTERTGGSDVGRTETVATPDASLGEGWYRLDGYKWFTSATTSEMAVTLARIADGDGTVRDGSRGLSTFYVPVRDPDGSYNGIQVERLKDKLGTRALPTAELRLQGTRALLISEPGRGVRTIATLVNVTRLHNAVNAVASLRRGLLLARDYAGRRAAFGKPLSQHALHVETLAALEVEARAGFLLSFHALELLGKEDCGEATEDERAELRLLTPLAKLFTAKQAVAGVSEVLECFGGAGYLEDTGLPRLLRDTQVLSIWEGTTNVLSLDVLRAIRREEALAPTLAAVEERVSGIHTPALWDAIQATRHGVGRIRGLLPALADAGPDVVEATAREFAFGLTRTIAASLLIEHAHWAIEQGDAAAAVAAARRWCERDLVGVNVRSEGWLSASAKLALG
jgi:alkylation response protein AidB-like acyl-CoA dehydrogenase